MPTIAQNKAAIVEDTKNVLEDSQGAEEDNAPHEIFTREANKRGMCDVLELSKDDLLTLSWRDDDDDAAHLSKVDAGRIRILLH